MVYETALECETVMEMFRVVYNQSIDTIGINIKDRFFEELLYCHIAGQRHQRALECFNLKKTE